MNKESKKFYSERAISITTFFGGPLAAGILMRQNYLNFGNEKQGTNALFIGIVSTIIIFGGLFVLPEHIIDKIPSAIIPAIYTLIIYIIIEKTQSKELKLHRVNNGEFYSAWKAAKVGALSMSAILIVIFSIAFIAGDLSKTEPDFDTEAYDKNIAKFVNNEATSLNVFEHIETASVSYLNMEINKSILLWLQNKNLIEQTYEIRNLPHELVIQNKKLMEYCELRIDHFELILKALNENNEKYDEQIYSIVERIDKKIEELE